jgi:hypothetical protein
MSMSVLASLVKNYVGITIPTKSNRFALSIPVGSGGTDHRQYVAAGARSELPARTMTAAATQAKDIKQSRQV